MFRFGFSESKDQQSNPVTLSESNEKVTSWSESQEIVPNQKDEIVKKITGLCKTATLQCEKNFKIIHVFSADVLDILKNLDSWHQSSVCSAEETHSDLITAIYEGGVKIWECTYDLLSYLDKAHIPLRDKNVLDLGCGAGIVGIFCLIQESSCMFQDYTSESQTLDFLESIGLGGVKIWECTYDLLSYLDKAHIPLRDRNVLDLGCGAGIVGIFCLIQESSCMFQDYNSEVIRYITIPNVILNSKDYICKSRFYYGDWDSFKGILLENTTEEDKFDYIFTSETIYNPDSYLKLHNVFKYFLKKNGTVYLAAKSYYFGVGGGVSLFKDYLDVQNTFSHSVCWQSTDGITREILELRFK